jgi:hypothetical protein
MDVFLDMVDMDAPEIYGCHYLKFFCIGQGMEVAHGSFSDFLLNRQSPRLGMAGFAGIFLLIPD